MIIIINLIILIMKIGFLLNLTFLLCFMVTQLLMWLLDGTLMQAMAELFNFRSLTQDNHLKGLSNQTVASIFHNNYHIYNNHGGRGQ